MRRAGIIRLFLLFTLIATAFYFAEQSGHWFRLEHVIEMVKDSGLVGMLVFLLLFTLGTLIYLPGVMFVFVAVIIYGPWVGFLVSYVSSVLAMAITFYLIRGVGGMPLKGIQNPFLSKMTDRVNEGSLYSVIILRILFWFSPVLTYLLALSSMDARKFHLGNILGLPIPVAGFTLLSFFFKALVIKFFI